MELLVYKASAGSGKTFTLTVEYIAKLINDTSSYRHILAVTFTNKATTEMKERILSQLYGIWKNELESDAYFNEVKKRITLPDGEIRKRAGEALFNIIHDYNYFRVETIDSFFQSVIRNLARELGLNLNLNVELKNKEVLSESVDSLIEKLSPGSHILRWLLDYIHEKIQDERYWNISQEVKSFGNNIFDEKYIELGKVLREKMRNPQFIANIKKELVAIRTEALEQMKGFYDQFHSILSQNGLTVDDLAYKATGIASYFNKLNNGELLNETLNTRAQNCLNNASAWSTKKAPNKDQIIQLAEQRLIPLLQDAEEFRNKNNIIVQSCTLSLAHLNQLQLLNSINEEVQNQNRKNNRFLLSETNALLHDIIKEEDSSFVFEKIGSNIKHVMIDEFQDTSRMQWDNFQILLMEGLSQGYDSLIVGDVKQSIYRWRNGDWTLLNNLGVEKFPYPIRIETLKTNRRSESNIISFNNHFFIKAVNYLNTIYTEELGEDCQPLLSAYSDVIQESPKKEKKGFVKASFIDSKESDYSYEELTILQMKEQIDELVAKGVQLKDIAILVRKNKAIPPIADYFQKETHYTIVSDEAFQLKASIAINVLIDAIRFLVNPENTIVRAQLLVTYQNKVKNEALDLDTLLSNDARFYLPNDFLDQKDELKLMPLYELLEQLYNLFNLDKLANQEAYLFSFFDAVSHYLESNSSDLGLFIQYWDEILSLKTIPSGDIDGIRILSIHKSKGLEFHTVLIPFCDWNLEVESPTGNLIWCAPEYEPFNHLDIVPINYSSRMSESIYKDDYLEERLHLWIDNLNILYVAFTRAGKNLILWGQQNKKNTVSELLIETLSSLQIGTESSSTYWNNEENIFTYGEVCSSQSETTNKESTNPITQTKNPIDITMQSMTPNIQFRQSNRSADFIEEAGGETELSSQFIDRGQLLHTLFSEIKTLEDIEPAITKLLFEGIIESVEEEEKIRKITQEAFNQPIVKEWFSDQWNILNESAILFKSKDTYQQRRPDRVMIKNDQVVVIDFKFGQPHKKYNSQIKEYINLLIAMGYSNVKGYIWYVLNKQIEEI